jgi:predicted RNase H-like HicB family nuclease
MRVIPLAATYTVYMQLPLTIELEQEKDGRWIAEVTDLPGIMVYGQSREEALAKVRALTLRVIADRLEHGEPIPQVDQFFATA